ncbi:hypothetical protein CXY01_22700 [Cellulomonas xylanilytica]|uniref:Uncharacterized protein n=1 Tax=Cellulomonas xylanilytica TaxID=233583 RepID=A0A510V916_9CELL|nr:hypothetical protein CXY01_22700 [Cellulomonas xylanilytica]
MVRDCSEWPCARGKATAGRSAGSRSTAARRRAVAGDGGWVDRTDVDSCHRVWFELHEDLVATLGIDRHSHP